MRLTEIRNWFNRTLIFPRQHRLLFYSVIGAQLRAGVTLVAEGMFRAFLLLSIMLLLITMGKGMYEMLTNIT